MSSYLKRYQDFLQSNTGFNAVDLPEDEDDEEMEEDVPHFGELENVSTSMDSLGPKSSNTSIIIVNAKNTTGNLTSSNSNNSINSVGNKAEQSFTREKSRPLSELSTGLMPARTILVRKPPQNASSHTHPTVDYDLDEVNQAQIPAYNEITAKEAMNECGRIANYVRNINSDDDDWAGKINQTLWSNMQKTLFARVVDILDNDHLARLANVGRQNEAMQRRVMVDKSASRMRKALASVAWDPRITQWLHGLLLDVLPSTYMACYLDILQTLKSKLPTLMDKMLFGRPYNVSQELLAPVMKKQWEPTIIDTKIRKLPQNAVIVALPSMPTSGPVPKRLQKWYQHLASITQIVQITLPMSSGHTARQPLEQVAEQIVSVTRVKIQDLRNEDSSRSIILIGFNAGAALALQVAMSENIACVVCMGFAYNTFNGVRGTPEDRILDIKVPILFVIGQNSARTSTEEIEGLREKMQSETALVVVGAADDVLRVPKSRRKLENVTQAMVDTMVMDELYDFIQRVLTNPPGPRIPTAITNVTYKSSKASIASGNSATGSNVQQRKRKMEGTPDNETAQAPVKTKYVPHTTNNQVDAPLNSEMPEEFNTKRKVGRPRTRPLSATTSNTALVKSVGATQVATSTSTSTGKALPKGQYLSNSLTNDDLNIAIKSILNEGQAASKLNTIGTGSAKLMSNFDLVTQTKSTTIKSTAINPLAKNSSAVAMGGGVATPISGTKIKMIPANQFVQIKPPMQSQSKIYTIKTSAIQAQAGAGGSSIGNIVTSAATVQQQQPQQQQIFTLKSPNGRTTQFVTAAPATAQQKYTVVKNASGGTTLTLTSPKMSTSSGSVTGGSSQMDLSNIIDMPIIFADVEGNIPDGEALKTPMSTNAKIGSPNSGQLIINQKIIKDGNPSFTTTTTTTPGKNTILIGKGGTILPSSAGGGSVTAQLGKPNKVVFINRNSLKPCTNIISRTNLTQPLSKYTKVVLANPKTAVTTLVPHSSGTIAPAATSGGIASGTTTPIVSAVKQVNLQTLNAGGSPSNFTAVARQPGIINMANKSFQILNAGTGVSVGATGDKTPIRNIVVKPGSLKQIPPHLKSQLLNRNLTVRKVVNVVATGFGGGTPITDIETTKAVKPIPSPTMAIQSAPKIITISPISRTVTTPSGTSGKTKTD